MSSFVEQHGWFGFHDFGVCHPRRWCKIITFVPTTILISNHCCVEPASARPWWAITARSLYGRVFPATAIESSNVIFVWFFISINGSWLSTVSLLRCNTNICGQRFNRILLNWLFGAWHAWQRSPSSMRSWKLQWRSRSCLIVDFTVGISRVKQWQISSLSVLYAQIMLLQINVEVVMPPKAL